MQKRKCEYLNTVFHLQDIYKIGIPDSIFFKIGQDPVRGGNEICG